MTDAIEIAPRIAKSAFADYNILLVREAIRARRVPRRFSESRQRRFYSGVPPE